MTGVLNVLFTSPAIGVPPVATLYHLKFPSVVPAALSVKLPAPHLLAPVTDGAEGTVLIVAITSMRTLSQNASTIDTKYDVVTESAGVLNELLVSPASGVPPVATSYHR